jgi:hypothetical protein
VSQQGWSNQGQQGSWPSGGGQQPAYPLVRPPQPGVFLSAPGYQARGNGLAVAALVLGITCILFCWWGVFTLAQVVLAVTFGAVGVRRSNRDGAPHRGLAIAGLVLGTIGAFLYLCIGLVSLGVGWII